MSEVLSIIASGVGALAVLGLFMLGAGAAHRILSKWGRK